ncbi:MAG: hypothetical protein J6K49_09150 [Clostridia bacterium]|nr:hypothetical protein [Clostridia bacterium]
MKLRKLLSALLVAVMIFSIFAINVSADAPLSFTVTETAAVSAKGSLMKELFNINVTIDESKFCALDGYTDDYTITINSAKVKDPVTAEYYDYYTDPDKFFSVFTSGTEENPFAGALVEVEFTIEFASNHVFGELNYTIDISGFMEPYSIGFGPVDDALSNVALPVEVKKTGNIWQFPAIENITINSVPVKSNYYDTEKFDLEGTQVYVETKVATAYDQRTDTYTYEAGKAGTVTYSEANSNMFTCNPSKDEKLSVLSTEVVTFFAGQYLSRIPVNVDHKVSDGYVCITTDYYTENKPGYHAKVCEGCGEAHDAQPHEVNPDAWVSNNDATFMNNGTESTNCLVCNAVLTRNTFGTAGFNETFADYHFILVIFQYINVILRVINGAV